MRVRQLGCIRLLLAAVFVVALLLPVDRLAAQTVARCGKGWLELIDGYPVLHLKGTPREMGYQHGALLREKTASNMHNLLELRGEATLVDFGPVKVTPRQAIQSIIEIQKKHVPPKFFDELAGGRYKELVRRVQAGHGQFTAATAIELMSRPVAMKSNLHNVLFEPKSTKFWVANASPDKKPAAEQEYFAFQLSELLKRQPEVTSPEIPLAAK